MKLDISEVKYSKNDLKIGVKVPTKLDENLAHLMGIHMGDGHLRRTEKNDYRIEYDGHYINEFYWYHTFLSKLIQKLFNKKAIPRKGHNTIKISISSKAIHTFLNKVCGLPIGPKNKCYIPEIIKKSNRNIKAAFLRGLADTDFSLVFKNRHKDINYYPVIDFQTSNKNLRDSILILLNEMGFKAYSNNRMQRRYDKVHASYYFQINGIKAFRKWVKEIGFTNHNQVTKIKVWNKFGFLPPKTNINDRLQMLKEKIKKGITPPSRLEFNNSSL